MYLARQDNKVLNGLVHDRPQGDNRHLSELSFDFRFSSTRHRSSYLSNVLTRINN